MKPKYDPEARRIMLATPLIEEDAPPPEHDSIEFVWEGERRGSEDWLAGIHVNPFLPADRPPDEEEEMRSLGWRIGQDYHFRRAAEEFPRLMRGIRY